MSFSQDGTYLVGDVVHAAIIWLSLMPNLMFPLIHLYDKASSGKDRRICIWKRVNNDAMGTAEVWSGYELSAAADSAHKRIVWSVHFCPRRPDILASGSRDGFAKVWRVIEGADGSLEVKELMR